MNEQRRPSWILHWTSTFSPIVILYPFTVWFLDIATQNPFQYPLLLPGRWRQSLVLSGWQRRVECNSIYVSYSQLEPNVYFFFSVPSDLRAIGTMLKLHLVARWFATTQTLYQGAIVRFVKLSRVVVIYIPPSSSIYNSSSPYRIASPWLGPWPSIVLSTFGMSS